MKVLFVSASMDRNWGGPVTAIESITSHLANHFTDIVVVAPVGSVENPNNVDLPWATLKTFSTSRGSSAWTGLSLSLHRWLMNHVRDFDLVHIHELWHFPHWAAIRAAAKSDVPYVVTPHGELNPEQLENKRFKKQLFLKLFERKALSRAAAVQTLTDDEASILKRVVPSAKTITIPNGSDHLADIHPADHAELPLDWQIGPDDRVILFVGRLTRLKGIHLLGGTMRKILNAVPSAHLLMVGPDTDGSGIALKQEVNGDDRLKTRVTFTGPLDRAGVAAAMAAADMFVLPSLAEGFSVSTLEALAFGLPAVITTHCHFEEVEKFRAGKVVAATEDAIARAVVEICLDSDLRADMGRNAKRLSELYRWDRIAERIESMYREILAARS